MCHQWVPFWCQIVQSISLLLLLPFLQGDSLTDNGNTNPRCGELYSMAKLAKASFYCKPRKTGRYLNIRLVESSMALTLCEVEVYSESRGVFLLKMSRLFTTRAIMWRTEGTFCLVWRVGFFFLINLKQV